MFGDKKNNNLAKTILGYYINLLEHDTFFSGIESEYISSLDGDYVIYYFDKKIKNLKNKMMKIESSAFGRLIDLDVYIDSSQSIRRTNLRKCVICDSDAFSCIRSKKHTFDELYQKYLNITYPYIKKMFSKTIFDSMDMELKLSPKFGSVTKIDSGSHKDLNYDIMYSCAKMLNPYFISMFKVGFFEENKEDIFSKINKIGRCAEDEMFKVYKTNCYKGLIFCLGILVCAFGRYLSSLDNISIHDAISDTIYSYKINEIATFGFKEYMNGFLGIRGEVKSSYKTIRKIYKKVDIHDQNKLFLTFLSIVKEIDDTVLLKRAGSFNKYLEYKKKISSAYMLNNEELNKLNTECIKENISLGGSCDILVCTIFVKMLEEELKLKELF